MVPAPLVNVQVLVVANGSAVVKEVPVLENRICVTALCVSDAESVSNAVRLEVAPAPPWMTMVPVGVWVSAGGVESPTATFMSAWISVGVRARP